MSNYEMLLKELRRLKVTDEILESLSLDEDLRKRMFVAEKTTSLSLLKNLVNDSEDSVVSAAMANPAIPLDVLIGFLNEDQTNLDKIAAAIANPNFPREILDRVVSLSFHINALRDTVVYEKFWSELAKYGNIDIKDDNLTIDGGFICDITKHIKEKYLSLFLLKRRHWLIEYVFSQKKMSKNFRNKLLETFEANYLVELIYNKHIGKDFIIKLLKKIGPEILIKRFYPYVWGIQMCSTTVFDVLVEAGKEYFPILVKHNIDLKSHHIEKLLNEGLTLELLRFKCVKKSYKLLNKIFNKVDFYKLKACKVDDILKQGIDLTPDVLIKLVNYSNYYDCKILYQKYFKDSYWITKILEKATLNEKLRYLRQTNVEKILLDYFSSSDWKIKQAIISNDNFPLEKYEADVLKENNLALLCAIIDNARCSREVLKSLSKHNNEFIARKAFVKLITKDNPDDFDILEEYIETLEGQTIDPYGEFN